jgi:2-oxoisovalerate dehydrogenase E1 component alpha subunit
MQRGFTLKDFMSQLTSNKNDPGKGRNMPCHYSGRAKTGVVSSALTTALTTFTCRWLTLMSQHAVASTLGTQIPHATGAAYALKMHALENPTEPPRVAVAYFGDGAASEGDFHGALNIAATRQCPVIFICRNNGFAISTPTSEQYRGDGIASRAAGYGIEALRVDGTDIFAVYEATVEARRRALEHGGRPILLEMMSYRISHHSTSDDSLAYRKRDEVEIWKNQVNPLTRLRKWLELEGLWDEKMEVETRTAIRRDVVKELAAAERERRPVLKSVFDDVYAELTEEMEEQRSELRRVMEKYPEEYDTEEHDKGISGL